MSKKTISIISYITIIGWIIAFLVYNNETEKSSLAKFHLKQSLGLGILGLLSEVLSNLVPSLDLGLTILSVGLLILWIIGIVNAVNEEEKPVPLVGNLFIDKFDFIK